MALGNGLNFPVLIDGVSQVLLTNASVNGQTNRQDIDTMFGLVGFSEGIKKLEISFETAILQGGPEVDIPTLAWEGSIHEIQVPYGPKSLVSEGTFKDFTIQRSTNTPSSMPYNFTGTFTKPK